MDISEIINIIDNVTSQYEQDYDEDDNKILIPLIKKALYDKFYSN